MSKFNLIFVTIPSRILKNDRYIRSIKEPWSSTNLFPVLKRREPKKEANGEMGWTELEDWSLTEAAALKLLKNNIKFTLNVEDCDSPNEELVQRIKDWKCGWLVSGSNLTKERLKLWIMWAKENKLEACWIGVENEEMFRELINDDFWTESCSGLIIGSSYLSESSKMYDLWGLSKFRSMARALGKKYENKCLIFSTSNYCTFEKTGAGDKSKEFVEEQLDFLKKYQWGSITRFYGHVKIVNNFFESFYNEIRIEK